MNANAGVTVHYAADSMGRALCGAEYDGPGRITAWEGEATCPDCRAELAESAAPVIACTQVHEHDAVACAAPSVAELTMETVGARLAELHARIEAVFDDDTDRHFALERAQEEIGDLLRLLGRPVVAAGAE